MILLSIEKSLLGILAIVLSGNLAARTAESIYLTPDLG